jgi:5-methylcytosine-specific restriction endonuclease McrA
MAVVLNEPTLVLNRHWVPIDVTTVLVALCKLYDGAARAIKPDDFTLHDFDSWASLKAVQGQLIVRTATLEIPVPEIIVLSRYSGVPDRCVTFSRRNLYRRDKYTCQYCGARPGTEELTIDHVTPRSRGGASTWSNCVLSCIECNRRKADHIPNEVGLALRRKPFKPRWTPRLLVAKVAMKTSWERFISDAYWNVELME